ncbi:unnamed protein product [Closterium sp. Naga37s-1]|nr:unnamed protein product [Closterium sp. Naga37s-1]
MSLFRPACLSHSSQAALPQQAEGVLELKLRCCWAGRWAGVRPYHSALRYRSRQRGFLELDLLLGKWVEQHLPSLDPPHLTALARLMDESVFYPPPHLPLPSASPSLSSQVYTSIRSKVYLSIRSKVYLSIRSKVDERLHRMHPAVKAAPGLPRVRGWEDTKVEERLHRMHPAVKAEPGLPWVYLSIRSKVEERLHRMHPAVKAEPGLPWVREDGRARLLTAFNHPPSSRLPLPPLQVYLSIRSKVDERLHRMHPAVKAEPGLPWVRGWEDMQRQPGTPPAGNQ